MALLSKTGAVLALLALLLLGGDGLEILRAACVFRWATTFSTSASETEGAVHAGDAPAAGHVEHVALAQQLLGALLAQDRAAVDLRGDLEGDPGREVRLDRAGDHVDRRALRRQHDVDARRARHLGQALDRALDLLAGHHHQVGHLVDDHHDIGQGSRSMTSSS
jgi:hypothetical protein